MVVTWKNKTRFWFVTLAVAIPLIHFLIFYVYVNTSAIAMAFLDAKGNVSIDNFVRFFNELSIPDTDLRVGFQNTLLTFLLLLLQFPFTVLVSYFLYKKIPLSGFYRITFFLPMVLFSVCVSLFFARIAGVNGVIAQKLGEWFNNGITPEILADTRFANIAVILHLLWLTFPGDLIIWGGTFARIPAEVLEAGAIDGTTSWTEFTKIVVPMVWPTVALKMCLMCCGIFSASGSAFLLTEGKYGTMTFATWIYLQIYYLSGNTRGSNVFNYLSAVGLITTAVAITITLIVRKYTDKKFEEVEF